MAILASRAAVTIAADRRPDRGGRAFGILFVGLAQAGRGGGLWPVASERTSALLVAVVAAVKSRAPGRGQAEVPPV
jgi:hypothetical protein